MAKTPTLPNGRLDFEKMVRGYAKEMGMSFSQAMKWFSERTSLQAACELLGLKFTTGVSAGAADPSDLDILNQFGKFLERRGYTVPKLMELRSIEYQSGERDEMSKFRMTKEEYLAERRSGKSRTDIYTEHGISRGCLLQRLDKWGIRFVEDEEYVLSKLDKPAPVETQLTISAHAESAATVEASELLTEPSEHAQPVDNLVDNSVDNTTSSVQEPVNERRYVTIRIPVQPMELPEVINTKDLDRGELLEAAFRVAQASVSWAYNDLVELIGEDEVAAHIQKYVDRKWAAYREQEGIA